MKKLLTLLFAVWLILGTAAVASALIFTEGYGGSQPVHEGDAYNFGFDYLNNNNVSAVDTDSSLSLHEDADALHPAPGTHWKSAKLFFKLYSRDDDLERVGFELEAWDSADSVWTQVLTNEVEFDLVEPDNKYVKYWYSLTPEQLIALDDHSSTNLRITALAADAFDNDFVIKKVYMKVEAIPNPEPATLMLLGSGLVGLGAVRKRFRK
jgi:hypothetical protein